MSHLIILGATGSLGRQVVRQALAGGHDVSVLVRNPSRLPPEVRNRVSLHTGDLHDGVRPEILRAHDALINCAGHVSEGQRFVDLVDHVVASVESLHAAERPVCWFLAGVAVLDIDTSGRRGVDLPKVKETYWPHRVNFERLRHSPLNWRLLCPGPMVEQAGHGLERLRISIDYLPVQAPADTRALPDLQVLATLMTVMPQMIVPYPDAAALMLANVDRGSGMTRHRVGLALPFGLEGHTPQWTATSADSDSDRAKPSDASVVATRCVAKNVTRAR